MKLKQIAEAYAALNKLADKEYSYADAHRLAVFRGQLKEHLEFFIQEEEALMNEYGVKDDTGKVAVDEQGRFRVRDAAAYNEAHCELAEVEIDLAPLTLPAPEKISAGELAMLEGIVCFEGGGR